MFATRTLSHLAVVAVGALTVLGCAKPPESFVRVSDPGTMGRDSGWTSVELRNGLSFNDAWEETVDLLAKKFELEMISKDGGYVRTSWNYNWWKPGEQTPNYRVRTILKFAPDHKRVDLKTEAQYLYKKAWLNGTDTRLSKTLRTDLMGVVGRTIH
jgi:hypothetical protein